MSWTGVALSTGVPCPVTRVGVVVAMAVALGSCSERPDGPVVEFEDLSRPPFVGTVVTGAPVVVAPDMTWSKDGDGWTFRGDATLVIRIVKRLERPIWIRVVPSESLLGRRIRVTYDGQMLAEGVVSSRASWSRRLPVQPSAPGTYRLRFEVVGGGPEDGSTSDASTRVGFAMMGWGLGWKAQNVSVEPVNGQIFVRRFLDLGLAGPGPTSYDGALLIGPQAVSRKLLNAQSQWFSFEAVNGSRGPAVFEAQCGGELVRVTVPPLASRELRIAIPRGPQRLVVRAIGNRHGLYLVGRPSFVGGDLGDLTPVVLITLDTVRRDSVDLFRDSGHTPVLAGISREATVYENAWATSPWTLPSHASIFTGRYPSHHLAGVTRNRLGETYPTAAARLRDTGYFTCAAVGGLFTSSRFGVLRGFATVVEPPRGTFELTADRITERAVECIEAHPDGNFFLFLNYFDAHAMYLAPDEHREAAAVPEALERLPQGSRWRDVAGGDLAAWVELTSRFEEPAPEVIELLRRLYRAEIAFVDYNLGRVREALEGVGLWQRALVIITSDHGETFGEEGWFQHSYRLVPELMEIPLVVKWPGQAESSRDSRLVSLVDLYSTVLKAAGVEPAPGDGEPLQLTSPQAEPPRRVLMEEHSSTVHPLVEEIRIAERLYGMQWLDRREVFWRGGLECSVGFPGAWYPTRCNGGWSTRFSDLPESIRSIADLPEVGVGGDALEPELAEKLRVLGYIQ